MSFLKKLKLPKIRFRSGALVCFWSVVMMGLLAFVEKRQSSKVCQLVSVTIDDEGNNHFIDDADVNNLMTLNERENLIGESHHFIDLKQLENRVKEHGFVEKVVVSKDLKGNIEVKVKQYRPIARLSLPNGNDRYISSIGKILPLSSRFTARVIVLDGPFTNVLSQKDWYKDSLRMPYFEFLGEVLKDDFLKVLVASANINRKGEINIYPQIGRQVIEFGLPENIPVKFSMMQTFYKKIIPVKGWNKYSKVSLKYKNQIVCE